jgi:hypothetical protein
MKKLALASYISQLITSSYVHSLDSEILKLTLGAYYYLSESDMTIDLVKATFELRFLTELGFMPDYSQLSYPPAVKKALDYITGASIERVFMFKLGAESTSHLAFIAENLILHEIDKKLPTLDFYKSI